MPSRTQATPPDTPRGDSLYGAQVSGPDGRPRIATYLEGDCTFSAICRAPSPRAAARQLAVKLSGRRGDWAVVLYARDSSEYFEGKDGYELVVSCPGSLVDSKVSRLVGEFLDLVEGRIGRRNGRGKPG